MNTQVMSLVRSLALVTYPILLTSCTVVDELAPINIASGQPPKAHWQAASSFSARSLTKLAVVVEDKTSRSHGDEDALVRSVEDQFIAKLLEKGYQVSARSDVKKVLEEIRFQQSGLTEDGAAKLGRMLNASAVLIVTINSASVNSRNTGWVINGVPQQRHTAICNMSARLISVEKAEILGISSFTSRVSASDQNDTSPGAVFAARIIAEAIPARNEQPGASLGNQ